MMRALLTALLLCFVLSARASGKPVPAPHNFAPEIFIAPDTSSSASPRDSSEAAFRKEKLIASILAFPVPFGFTGLHRIYLGSAPWVPVAYLISGGGGLGLLPLIDFIFIVTANEEEFRLYENNPNFFMWVK